MTMIVRRVAVLLPVALSLASPSFAQSSLPLPSTDTQALTEINRDATQSFDPGVQSTIRPVPNVPSGLSASTIGGDFGRFFSTENARLIGIFGGMALAASALDNEMAEEAVELPNAVFHPGSIAGGFLLQAGIGVATLTVGKASGHSEITSLGSELVRAQIVSQGIVQGLKFAVGRSRPDDSDKLSFPSGHTASAFATATVLERRFGWKVGIPAYALGGYIAASRMADNRHHLSDVLVGAAIGIAAGRTVTFGSGKTAFDMGVSPAAGGVAVTFKKR
jgi:hypothetical protein